MTSSLRTGPLPVTARQDAARSFPSVLFDREEAQPQTAVPDYFGDLNLDQVFDAVTAGATEYDLKPFFQSPLASPDAILFRHEVFRDLSNTKLFDDVERFAASMRDVRVHTKLSSKLYYKLHKEGWLVRAIEIYCAAVQQFAEDLTSAPLSSRGLMSFRDHLSAYIVGADFISLRDEGKRITEELSQLRYSVLINGGSFTVRRFHEEADYSAEVESTFERFKQGAVTNYLTKYSNAPEDMNSIEAKVLEFVSRLYPDAFARLTNYCARQRHFVDNSIAVFEREIQFYISYLKLTTKLRRAGLSFCLPEISHRSKNIRCREGFDVALALKLAGEGKPTVCNDFDLKGTERVIVVSGPNQGGKTTFARMFGQLHYLACLGCPVPSREARLFLFDRLFTHFERQEKVENLRGKLEDDLLRIRLILDRTSSNSILVLNEIFTSTTIRDEVFLSKKIMRRIIERDLLCIWVTFVDELSAFSRQTVSMVSTVVPDQPALRTFKIEQRRADGLAYAMAIAEKYRLTYDRVKERVPA